MAISRHSVIAPEGWRFIGPILVVSIGAHYFLGPWSIPFWLLSIFTIIIFRDPSRQCPAAPLAIISPVHGTVSSIGLKQDNFLKREANFISIKMPFYTSFSVCSITEGKVMNQWSKSQDNTDQSCPCFAIWIQTDELDDVLLVLRPGRWIHRICSYFITGERVGQGHRMGFILFGTTVDVYLPITSVMEVQIGHKITAGADILAQLVHK
jgi:phosphatidylserine decarboxylase